MGTGNFGPHFDAIFPLSHLSLNFPGAFLEIFRYVFTPEFEDSVGLPSLLLLISRSVESDEARIAARVDVL